MKPTQFFSNLLRAIDPNCMAVALLSILWTVGASAFPMLPPKAESNVTRVAEGFYTLNDKMPGAVISAWESTFFVHAEVEVVEKDRAIIKSSMGTAFLVGRMDEGESSTLYFLTNYHVIRGFCDSTGVCSNLKLAPEALAEMDENGSPHLHILKEQLPNEIEVQKFSEMPDLALLKTTVARGSYPFAKPLPLSGSCNVQQRDPLYAVGFAALGLRKNSQGAPSEKMIFKRWSSGLAVNLFLSLPDTKGKSEPWLGTTVDILPGASGGPLLNEAGEIVGVVEATKTQKGGGFKYLGSEDSKSTTASSYHITCKSMMKFLNEK